MPIYGFQPNSITITTMANHKQTNTHSLRALYFSQLENAFCVIHGFVCRAKQYVREIYIVFYFSFISRSLMHTVCNAWIAVTCLTEMAFNQIHTDAFNCASLLYKYRLKWPNANQFYLYFSTFAIDFTRDDWDKNCKNKIEHNVRMWKGQHHNFKHNSNDIHGNEVASN